MADDIDDAFKALGLMGALIAIETVGALARKGVLTPLEAREVLDKSQLNLEMRVAAFGPRAASVMELARGYLEDALSEHSPGARPLSNGE